MPSFLSVNIHTSWLRTIDLGISSDRDGGAKVADCGSDGRIAIVSVSGFGIPGRNPIWTETEEIPQDKEPFRFTL